MHRSERIDVEDVCRCLEKDINEIIKERIWWDT